VPTAIEWDEPVREHPDYARPIAAMLSFLCPGEKMAVTGASYISNLVRSEEAKFYFAEQALEEAKHFDALRRMIPKITGRPMEPPGPWVRLLYSFGVLDRDDVAFMMGNINIIGEHLANQIFHKINHVAQDEQLKKLLALIGRDESRHIAAGQRFFPEVFPEFERNRHRIMLKNLTTCTILAIACYDLVRPMRALNIDLGQVLEAMFRHYHDVTGGFKAFPDAAVFEVLLGMVRRSVPPVMQSINAFTTADGEIDVDRFLAQCRRALTSPRALREIFAG
jgi:rubrerythrin